MWSHLLRLTALVIPFGWEGRRSPTPDMHSRYIKRGQSGSPPGLFRESICAQAAGSWRLWVPQEAPVVQPLAVKVIMLSGLTTGLERLWWLYFAILSRKGGGGQRVSSAQLSL